MSSYLSITSYVPSTCPVLGLRLGNQVSAWISKTYSGFLLVLARGRAVFLDENGCTVRDEGWVMLCCCINYMAHVKNIYFT